MYISRNAPEIREIINSCFPKNKNQVVTVKEFAGPVGVNSYWSGGSKDEYVLYSLSTNKTIPFPESHPYFSRNDDGERCGNLTISELPENTALVCGGWFCGKPMCIRILLRPENIVKLLPPKQDIPEQEKTVLSIVQSKGTEYRRDAFRRNKFGHYSVDHPLVQSLAKRSPPLIKISKNGRIRVTIEGMNITN